MFEHRASKLAMAGHRYRGATLSQTSALGVDWGMLVAAVIFFGGFALIFLVLAAVQGSL